MMAEQHQRLGVALQLADRHINEPAHLPLELDVERRQERDALLGHRGVTHHFDGVGLDRQRRVEPAPGGGGPPARGAAPPSCRTRPRVTAGFPPPPPRPPPPPPHRVHPPPPPPPSPHP